MASIEVRSPAELLQSVEKWIVGRAAHFARKFETVGAEDLAQEGRIAAWNAAQRFDVSRGITFLSYCRQGIDWKIQRYCIEVCGDVRIPHGRFFKEKRGYVFLDAPLDEQTGPKANLSDIFDSDDGRMEEELELSSAAKRLEQKLKGLKPMEIDVLRRRFWAKQTLKEIGEEFGVSRERIRQIEAKALRKLRWRMKQEDR
jgi:RNA polymerase sigma factor (sigma-70 family)